MKKSRKWKVSGEKNGVGSSTGSKQEGGKATCFISSVSFQTFTKNVPSPPLASESAPTHPGPPSVRKQPGTEGTAGCARRGGRKRGGQAMCAPAGAARGEPGPRGTQGPGGTAGERRGGAAAHASAGPPGPGTAQGHSGAKGSAPTVAIQLDPKIDQFQNKKKEWRVGRLVDWSMGWLVAFHTHH